MLWEDVLKTTQKYTDDNNVLSMIKNWLIMFSVFNIFGITINRKFKLNIRRTETDKELRTDVDISFGWWIFKRTFSISDITKKKKKSKIKKFQQKPKTSVVYIDKKEEPKTEEQSDIVIEFYEWKKRMIAKSLGLATG